MLWHDIAKILLKSVLNINQSICHCDDQMQSMPINIKVVTFLSDEEGKTMVKFVSHSGYILNAI
jgi:hypothetical protein